MIDSLDGMQTLNLVVLPKLGDCFPLSEIQLPYLRWPPLLKKKKKEWNTLGVRVCSVAQSCLTLAIPRTIACHSLSFVHGGFPSENTGIGCHFLFQGKFPTQGLNLRLLYPLHSLPLSHLGSPYNRWRTSKYLMSSIAFFFLDKIIY